MFFYDGFIALSCNNEFVNPGGQPKEMEISIVAEISA